MFPSCLRMQFWMATKRPSIGTLVTLRVPTSVGGYTNPPTLTAPTLAVATSAGATRISIAATSAFGRLVAGDRMTVGSEVATVAADVASLDLSGATLGFASIPLAAPLALPHAAGATLTVAYAADVSVYGVISSFPIRLVDGQLILTEDLRVTVGTYTATGTDLSPPLPGGLMSVGADLRTIISVMPGYAGPTVVSYALQAR